VAIANLVVSSFEFVPADTRASAAGMLNLVGSLVSGFGPLLGGMWKTSVGIHHMMSYASVVYAAAGLFLAVGIKLYFQHDYDRVH
jgi:hypothetical protein